MDQDHQFEIITFKIAIKKGRPYQKPSIQKIVSVDGLEKAIEKHRKNGTRKLEVIDKEKGSKTLYSKLLGAKFYDKKVVYK